MAASRVVWIKGGALGDFALALPVLDALRRWLPEAERVAVGPRAWLGLATDLAHRVEALEDRPWSALGRRDAPLPPMDVDLAVLLRPDPEGLARAALVAAGVRRVLFRPPLPEVGVDVHLVDHGLLALGDLAVPVRDPLEPLTLRPTEAERREARAALAGEGPFAVLLPGSGGASKRWPADRFRALGRALEARGLRPVVSLGPVEIELGEVGPWRALGWPVLEGLPPRALGAAFAEAALAVGNDAGTSHLSALYGCPTLALFGPTAPGLWAPRGRRVATLAAAGPCDARCAEDRAGMRRCAVNHPSGAARCITRITVEEALVAAERLLTGGET